MITVARGRTNRWLITPGTYEAPGFRDFLDLRGEPLDEQLRDLNQTRHRLHLCVAPSDYDELAYLHTARPHLPLLVQRLAILINHHACLYTNELAGLPSVPGFRPAYRQLDFGNAAPAEAVDRFGVGATRPQLWVLGEQANPRALSFPLPFATTAGHSMLWPHVNPWYTRVSNVLEPGETPSAARSRVAREWRQLGEPMVLLLGNVAARLFHTQNILGYLEHPQFIWRFHHALREGWTKQFKEYQQRALEGAG